MSDAIKLNKRLLRALNNGKYPQALDLLKDGADPTARNGKGLNALLLLAQSPEAHANDPLVFQLIDMCLAKGCCFTDTTFQGDSVLHVCATNTSVLTHCLTHKPDCSVLNKRNESILHSLARNPKSSEQLISTLVQLGAQVNQNDKNHNSVFSVFCMYNFNGVKPLLDLIALGAQPTTQEIAQGCSAFSTDDTSMIAYFEYAKHNGVDFNTVYKDGVPLLERVVSSGYIKAVKYLLNNGVSITIETSQNMVTALDFFDHQKSSPILDLLIQHGFDLNGAKKHGYTMLHYLMSRLPRLEFSQSTAQNLVMCLDTLLTYGADLNAPDGEGVTPLSLALIELGDRYPNILSESADVQQYVHAIFDLLLDHGANLHQSIGDGTGQIAPLHTTLRWCELTELFEFKVAERQNLVLHANIENGQSVRQNKKM